VAAIPHGLNAENIYYLALYKMLSNTLKEHYDSSSSSFFLFFFFCGSGTRV
jgi:hypothetical protein